MSARLQWRNVIPGLIAIAMLAAFVAGVLIFGGVGRIPGEKTEVLVVAGHARGLINGSDVWLGGQKVGVIHDMKFLAPTADSQARLLIVAKVKESVATQIRRDSRVTIRAGGNFVGPIVLWIDPGTPDSPALTRLDTLRAEVSSELEIAGSRATAAAEEWPALAADAKRVVSYVRDPNGVRGAFTAPAIAQAKQLMATLNRASRRAPAANSRAALLRSARSALARVDSIHALLATPNGNVGRFRRDSTLARTVSAVRDELAALQARLDTTTGTLDRFARDSAIARAVADARQEMTLLVADVKKRPLRYIAF